MPNKPIIYCACDNTDLSQVLSLAEILVSKNIGIKLGLEFFNALGPQGIEAVQKAYPGASLFVDLKFHDIPNTVAQAVRAITRLQPDYLNLHASGGYEMMRIAHDALLDEAHKRHLEKTPQLLAVTILTSLTQDMLNQIGYAHPITTQVANLAALTQQAGLAGVVCSGHEIKMLREKLGPEFVLMVPGIRLSDNATQDQQRVMTPREAIQQGATHLVIGRPITAAANPASAIDAILETLVA